MLCGQLPSVCSGNCVRHLKTCTSRRVFLVKFGGTYSYHGTLKYKVVQIWPVLICTNVHTNQSQSYLNHLVLYTFLPICMVHSWFPNNTFVSILPCLNTFRHTVNKCTSSFPCFLNPYPTAFPYGNGMVLHFYQQQESSTTKNVHKVINRGLKTNV